jgi:hypothetical protein
MSLARLASSFGIQKSAATWEVAPTCRKHPRGGAKNNHARKSPFVAMKIQYQDALEEIACEVENGNPSNEPSAG